MKEQTAWKSIRKSRYCMRKRINVKEPSDHLFWIEWLFTSQSEVSPWLSPFKIISGYRQIVWIHCSVFISYHVRERTGNSAILQFSFQILSSYCWHSDRSQPWSKFHLPIGPFLHFQRFLCISFVLVILYYNIFCDLSIVFWKFIFFFFDFWRHIKNDSLQYHRCPRENCLFMSRQPHRFTGKR